MTVAVATAPTSRYRFEPVVASALATSSARIVVTGASGWIGRATLEMLAEAIGDDVPERIVCFGSSARSLTLRGGRTVQQRPLAEIADLSRQPTIVLHLAYLTKDRAETQDEGAYRAANDAITATVLAAAAPIGTTAVFLPSSGAVYRVDAPEASPAMRLYGAMKLADETALAAWAGAHDATLVTARVFSLTGPYINKPEHYALAALTLDALAGRPIAIRADRPVTRGFVAIRELMSLVFAMLLAPDRARHVFDTAGERVEMADLADAVRATLAPAALITRPTMMDAGADYYVGERTRYAALLDRFGIRSVPLDEQIRETAEYLNGASA